ncbi:MAG: hypothetical protein Q9N34_07250 [Aquificota bacterium]|nr:hypothetical protein [Aquificota bacterium]
MLPVKGSESPAGENQLEEVAVRWDKPKGVADSGMRRVEKSSGVEKGSVPEAEPSEGTSRRSVPRAVSGFDKVPDENGQEHVQERNPQEKIPEVVSVTPRKEIAPQTGEKKNHPDSKVMVGKEESEKGLQEGRISTENRETGVDITREHPREGQQPRREETRETKLAPERREISQDRQGTFSQSVSEPKEEVKEEVHPTLRRDVPLQNRGEVRNVSVRFEDTHLRFRFQSESLNVEIRLREDIQRQMGYLDVQRLSKNLESLGLSLEGLRINGVELLSRSNRHREKERFNIRERDGAGEKASYSPSDSPDLNLLL